MSYTVFWIIGVVLVFLALIAWYEYQLSVAHDQLAALLDKVEEFTDLATDPPFNLQLDDETLIEAFKLRMDPTFKSNVTFVEDGTWLEHRNHAVAEAEKVLSQAEIDEWN